MEICHCEIGFVDKATYSIDSQLMTLYRMGPKLARAVFVWVAGYHRDPTAMLHSMYFEVQCHILDFVLCESAHTDYVYM